VRLACATVSGLLRRAGHVCDAGGAWRQAQASGDRRHFMNSIMILQCEKLDGFH
jgi:hypothetical protein